MKNKKKKLANLSKDNYQLVAGYSRSPSVVTSKLEDRSSTIKEIDLKDAMKKRVYQEYMASTNDPKGKHLLDAIVNREPDVVRYVRLDKGEIKDPLDKFKKDMDTELVYVRTKISEESKNEDYLEGLYDAEDFEEIEEFEDEDEEIYEELDPLEYARTNISSRTEISVPEELKDDIAGRSLYYFDSIKPNATSVSDQMHKIKLKEEYLITGRTSISSNKYAFKKLSETSTPVVKKQHLYRLNLKNNEDLD